MGASRASLWLSAMVALASALLTPPTPGRSPALTRRLSPTSRPTCPQLTARRAATTPDPTPVEVTGVPTVVESTIEAYLVLSVNHAADGTEVE